MHLKPHPDAYGTAAIGVHVDVERRGPSILALRYRLTGRITEILLPPPRTPGRVDGLWQHTCFEAFLRPSAAKAYYEFNLAPSGQWAAYRFDDHRTGMQAADGMAPPAIQSRFVADAFEVEALLDLAGLAGPDSRLGLAAVIEEKEGLKSYWALEHPPGAPDFHHRDCFTLEVPPPNPA